MYQLIIATMKQWNNIIMFMYINEIKCYRWYALFICDMTHCTLHIYIYIDIFINLLSNQCSSQIENLLYAMRHTKYIQQYRSRIVPNNFTTTFIYTYKKKNIKITDIIYTYFAAEGLWNIDIIILFCNFDKTNS